MYLCCQITGYVILPFPWNYARSTHHKIPALLSGTGTFIVWDLQPPYCRYSSHVPRQWSLTTMTCSTLLPELWKWTLKLIKFLKMCTLWGSGVCRGWKTRLEGAVVNLSIAIAAQKRDNSVNRCLLYPNSCKNYRYYE